MGEAEERLLDGYLGATCERELQDAIVALARQNERSTAAEVRVALRAHIDRAREPLAVEGTA